MRNPRDGFYRLGEPYGDPRLRRAQDELTACLQAA